MTPSSHRRPTFAARVRNWLDAGVVTEKQLRLAGRPHALPKSTVNDIANGREPSLSVLRQWAAAVSLPEAVRDACVNAIEAADTVRLAGPFELDADGDGQITWKDAEVFCMRKQHAALSRRQHAVEHHARFDASALAEQERLGLEEVRNSRSQTLVMRKLAAAGTSTRRLP
jgi:hypothetical protein